MDDDDGSGASNVFQASQRVCVAVTEGARRSTAQNQADDKARVVRQRLEGDDRQW